MAITPEVWRIINYGGHRTDSTGGGSAVEHYAVVGIGPNEWAAAQSLGLPKKGNAHQHPEFVGLVGVVQEVSQIHELAPLLWIARVIYSVGGTFNFGTRINSSTQTFREKTQIPIISTISGGSLDPVFVERAPRLFIERFGLRKVDTRRTGISPDIIGLRAAENIGKIYQFQGIRYQLENVWSATDASNVTRVQTTFIHRAPFVEFPLGRFAAQDIPIPALPQNAEYDWDVPGGIVGVTDPETTYGNGGFLPWMPPF